MYLFRAALVDAAGFMNMAAGRIGHSGNMEKHINFFNGGL
jgi:hypothetical protein